MVLAPEVLLAKYWTEFAWGRSDQKTMEQLAEKDPVPWTKTHTIFANIGSFAVKGHGFGAPEDLSLGTQRAAPLFHQFPYPGLPNRAARDDEFSDDKIIHDLAKRTVQAEREPLQYRGNYNHLLVEDIIGLRNAIILPSLPYITAEEINDKSKNDAFVRAITLCQILSMVIQVLIQASRQLAVSQLEVAVVTSAFCAVAIYLLNWSKPHGVKTPIVIINYSYSNPNRVVRFVGRKDQIVKNTLDELVRDNLFACLSRSGRRRLPGHPISNLMGTSTSPSSHIITYVMGLFIGSVVFGGIHVFAWNFTFPTKYEQMTWRVVSTFCAGVIPA